MYKQLHNFRQDARNNLDFINKTEYYYISDSKAITLKEIPAISDPSNPDLKTVSITCLNDSGDMTNGFIEKTLIMQNDNYKYGDVYRYKNPTSTTFWVNFKTGEILFSPEFIGKIVQVSYLQTGNLVRQEHVNKIMRNFDNVQMFHQDPIINTMEKFEEFEITSTIEYNNGNQNEFIIFDDLINLYKPIYIERTDNGELANILQIKTENNTSKIYIENIDTNVHDFHVKLYRIQNHPNSKEIFYKFQTNSYVKHINYKFVYNAMDDNYKVYNSHTNVQIGTQQPVYKANGRPTAYSYLDGYLVQIIINTHSTDGDTIFINDQNTGHTHDGINSPLLTINEIGISQLEDIKLSMATNKDMQNAFLYLSIFNTAKIDDILFMQSLSDTQQPINYYINEFPDEIIIDKLI